jgi:hypothetical protein
VKIKRAIICGSVTLLVAISDFGALADPPGKEGWEARKEQMEYEREQRKRNREWEREQRKHYEELEREERKHLEEMAREERKHQEEMWPEGGYRLEQPGYVFDGSYEPENVEDKVYRVIKDVRDLTDTLNQ